MAAYDSSNPIYYKPTKYSLEDLIKRNTFITEYDKFWDSLYKVFPNFSEKHIMVGAYYRIHEKFDDEIDPMLDYAYFIPETLEIKKIDKISFVENLRELNSQNSTNLFALLEFRHYEKNISDLDIIFYRK